MTQFAFEPISTELTSTYLRHLQVDKDRPSLEFLNQLIKAHQERVPFENYTRIIDFYDYRGQIPPIDVFISRLKTGAGGVCWTMARGFGWLLKNLNFDVQYLYMDPGHVCLKVHLQQDYYVDVGYGAPLFAACPLRQSFEVCNSAETFQYQVQGDKVQVNRSPGPQKTLNLTPCLPEYIDEKFRQGNVWGKNRFLSLLLIGKYQDEKPFRIANQKLQDFRSGNLHEQDLNENEIGDYLENVFGIQKSYYLKAKALLANNLE